MKTLLFTLLTSFILMCVNSCVNDGNAAINAHATTLLDSLSGDGPFVMDDNALYCITDYGTPTGNDSFFVVIRQFDKKTGSVQSIDITVPVKSGWDFGVDNRYYYLFLTDGTVRRVTKTADHTVESILTVGYDIGPFKVDGDKMYMTTYSSDTANPAIRVLDFSSGLLTTLVEVEMEEYFLRLIDVDEKNVYYYGWQREAEDVIYRISKDEPVSQPVEIARGDAISSPIRDNDNIYYIHEALDDSYGYESLMRVSITGGVPELVIQDIPDFDMDDEEFVVADNVFYWGTRFGKLRMISLGDPQKKEVLLAQRGTYDLGDDFSCWIGIDEDALYWTAGTTEGVYVKENGNMGLFRTELE